MLLCPLSFAALKMDTHPFFNVPLGDKVYNIRALISFLHTVCQISADIEQEKHVFM